ncbi:MAG: glycine hydroxymethyltransferase [Parachlamydiaceae bacterium]
MKRIQNYLSSTPQNQQSAAAIAYIASLDEIEKKNPKIVESIEQELKDQRSYLKMIASENYCSYAVQLAMGNFMTDKYAEGFPGKRYYAGCDNVDHIEQLAVDEAKKLFGAEAAYVQPHSGADANLVAFWSILTHKVQQPEVERLGKKSLDELTPQEFEKIRTLLNQQKVMGLSLSSGGHLTHGYRMNVSAKMFHAIPYDVEPKTELLDYQAIQEQAKREKPLILLAGYSAYPRKINFAKFKEIADSVGAVLMVDMAHFAGLVAGKAFTGEFNPIPYADVVTSTTHKTLRGPRGGLVLCTKEYEDVVNKGCPLVLGGPLPHVLAAKAVAFREANAPEFSTYAKKVVENAKALAHALTKKGLRIVSGDTENHLLVLDLTSSGLTGRQGETALRQGHITVNRNSIPFDKNGAFFTSGLRLGTPALTTLGMGVQEMEEIAEIVHLILKNSTPQLQENGTPGRSHVDIKPEAVQEAHKRVKQLLTKFPLYPELP